MVPDPQPADPLGRHQPPPGPGRLRRRLGLAAQPPSAPLCWGLPSSPDPDGRSQRPTPWPGSEEGGR